MYQNLKLQMWRSGIRQNRLARELNMDETVLSKIINGYRRPSVQVKARIAKYFQMDEAWLFDTDSQPPAPRLAVAKKSATGAE